MIMLYKYCLKARYHNQVRKVGHTSGLFHLSGMPCGLRGPDNRLYQALLFFSMHYWMGLGTRLPTKCLLLSFSGAHNNCHYRIQQILCTWLFFLQTCSFVYLSASFCNLFCCSMLICQHAKHIIFWALFSNYSTPQVMGLTRVRIDPLICLHAWLLIQFVIVRVDKANSHSNPVQSKSGSSVSRLYK